MLRQGYDTATDDWESIGRHFACQDGDVETFRRRRECELRLAQNLSFFFRGSGRTAAWRCSPPSGAPFELKGLLTLCNY